MIYFFWRLTSNNSQRPMYSILLTQVRYSVAHNTMRIWLKILGYLELSNSWTIMEDFILQYKSLLESFLTIEKRKRKSEWEVWCRRDDEKESRGREGGRNFLRYKYEKTAKFLLNQMNLLTPMCEETNDVSYFRSSDTYFHLVSPCIFCFVLWRWLQTQEYTFWVTGWWC